MDVRGLTRLQVDSHLQTYRRDLKKKAADMHVPAEPASNPSDGGRGGTGGVDVGDKGNGSDTQDTVVLPQTASVLARDHQTLVPDSMYHGGSILPASAPVNVPTPGHPSTAL